MAEFYDEVFYDGNQKDEYDVDIIYPDGSSTEMFLDEVPVIGDIIFGYVVNKVIKTENWKEGDCFARIELSRRSE